MQQQNKHQESLAAQTLFDMATGFMRTGALIAAAQLGIADILEQGPQSPLDIATAAGAEPDTTDRLLRTLVRLGVLQNFEDGCYANTPMSTFLLDRHPASMRPFLLLAGDKSWWHAWGELAGSIRTGEPAFKRVFGMEYDDYLQNHPDLAVIFNRCMTSTAQANNAAIIDQYDFSPYRTVMDIGGNHGSLLIAILEQYPQMNGVLFDLPHVIETCPEMDTALSPRSELTGGNFFAFVPSGGDIYLLKQILHDWDDDQALRILKNCSKAMHRNARLLIIETVLDKENASVVNYLFDLHMLVTASGGKERTESEFHRLLERTGFRTIRTLQTPVSFCIIEAIKEA